MDEAQIAEPEPTAEPTAAQETTPAGLPFLVNALIQVRAHHGPPEQEEISGGWHLVSTAHATGSGVPTRWGWSPRKQSWKRGDGLPIAYNWKKAQEQGAVALDKGSWVYVGDLPTGSDGKPLKFGRLYLVDAKAFEDGGGRLSEMPAWGIRQIRQGTAFPDDEPINQDAQDPQPNAPPSSTPQPNAPPSSTPPPGPLATLGMLVSPTSASDASAITLKSVTDAFDATAKTIQSFGTAVTQLNAAAATMATTTADERADLRSQLNEQQRINRRLTRRLAKAQISAARAKAAQPLVALASEALKTGRDVFGRLVEGTDPNELLPKIAEGFGKGVASVQARLARAKEEKPE